VQAIEALGARVAIAGAGQDEADAAARRLVGDEGLTFIHPFDDPRVIAGQGTIGLEILEQVGEVASVVVPLSGGGLAGGVALAITGLMPQAQVVGVSQDRGPAMVRSIAAGHLVDVVEEDTLADALAGGLGAANDHSFHLCRTLLAGTALVSEDEIGDAMAFLHDSEGLVVEGGGAVGVAALRSGRLPVGGPTVVVISGGNVALDTLARVLTP
jgi:threonine dehydratase